MHRVNGGCVSDSQIIIITTLARVLLYYLLLFDPTSIICPLATPACSLLTAHLSLPENPFLSAAAFSNLLENQL